MQRVVLACFARIWGLLESVLFLSLLFTSFGLLEIGVVSAV